MFGSILRWWRLAAPLALVALASITMAAGTLTSASAAPAKTFHFAFAGDAAGLIDEGQFPADVACFSGALEASSINIRNGIADCVDVNLDSTENRVLAHADTTAFAIKSDHNKKEGHTTSDVADIGDVAVFGFFRDDSWTKKERVELLDSGDFARATAEAECQKGKTSVLGRTSTDELDMAQGNSAADGNNPRDIRFGALTAAGGSVTFITHFRGETLVLIVNESSVQKSDDFAAISLNALHFLAQNASGAIEENVIVAHAFAQIHCHTGNFSFEDGLVPIL